ncbi:MAG: M20/M25/M40 family metallo-hydrolase [Gemmatimonadales bacterium]
MPEAIVNPRHTLLLAIAGLLAAAHPLAGQNPPLSVSDLSFRMASLSAVTGYERALVDTVLRLLPGSARDRAGNAYLTLGAGSGRRLVVCPLDEPGYVVGGVGADGYLTLRRVAGRVGPLFDQQLEGHRVTILGRRGPIPGVVAVRSIHLTRGRPVADDPFTVDDAYVDVGASSRQEAAGLGIGVLAPVTLTKRPQSYGAGLLAAPAAGRRAACAALLLAARQSSAAAKTIPPVTVAFAVEQELSQRGLGTLANAYGPFDETLIVDGRPGARGALQQGPEPDTLISWPKLGRVTRWSLPVAYAGTAVETVSLGDAAALRDSVVSWIGADSAASSAAEPAPGPTRVERRGRPGPAPKALAEVVNVLAPLVESYGVSGMEGPVRALVEQQLPSWASTQTDTAGNLWLTVGKGEPTVVFVAHLDEIGFRITAIRDDGSLDLTPVGGLFPSLWEAKPALVHTGGTPVPGVFMPRDSGSAAELKRTPPFLRADVGMTSRAATEALGIAVGHTLTMPKQFVRLAGTRATGRSFDDRVGSAAQVLAVRRIKPDLLKHTVIFLWSTREEIGLEGARAAANALGLRPVRVHAIDTFVSADSPLEATNFGLAPLGRGAVARALDNSSVTPPALVDSLRTLARARGIPLQVGTTNGGNDGSVFAGYGVPDVPIGWPLRYSHSPAETIDLGDVTSLAQMIQAVAEDW